MSIFLIFFGIPAAFSAALLFPVLVQAWRREAKFNIWIRAVKESHRPPQRYEFDSSSWTGQ